MPDDIVCIRENTKTGFTWFALLLFLSVIFRVMVCNLSAVIIKLMSLVFFQQFGNSCPPHSIYFSLIVKYLP